MLAFAVAVVAALLSTTRSRLELTAEILHVIIRNERGLRRHLRRYVAYSHQWRPHLSLDKDAPIPRATLPPSAGRIVQISEVGGLHHHDERRAV